MVTLTQKWTTASTVLAARSRLTDGPGLLLISCILCLELMPACRISRVELSRLIYDQRSYHNFQHIIDQMSIYIIYIYTYRLTD